MPSSARTLSGNASSEFHAELAALYESWGILDLVGETAAALPPEWLRILDIARNLLDRHEIPGVPLADDLAEFFARPEEDRPQVKYRPIVPRYAPPLTSDVVLRPMQSLADYPYIPLTDLALGRSAADLFEFRLASGDVSAYYTRELRPPLELDDEEEEPAPAPPRRAKRQKVYVLLDVSNSMRDHQKLIFAKALVLAYLVRAAEEGAELYFRTFANTTHARHDSHSREEFAALAQTVLRVAPDGGTDIRKALDTAILDIKALDQLQTFDKLAARAPTEILLISDCESYTVPYIPPVVRLHTVHLSDGTVAKSAAAGFESIREASATLHEIDTAALWLPDSTLDRWLLREDLRLDSGIAAAMEPGKDEGAPRRAEALLAVYNRMEGKNNKMTGGKVVTGVSSFGRRGMINPFHLLAALFRALRFLHPRPANALAWKPAHVHHARGTTFRARP